MSLCNDPLRKRCPYLEFSGPHFAVFGLNTKLYRVNLGIQSKYWEIPTRKKPNTDTFYTVISLHIGLFSQVCITLLLYIAITLLQIIAKKILHIFCIMYFRVKESVTASSLYCHIFNYCNDEHGDYGVYRKVLSISN